MKVLDKYIIKQFLITFFFAIFLLSLIAIIIDITEKIDNFLTNKAPFSAIVFDYYLNFIPWITLLISPLFVFISVIFFTSRLTMNTEIIVMLNGGMSFYRLLMPYLFTSILLAFSISYYNHYILPKQNVTRIAFEESYASKKENQVFQINYHFQIGKDTMIYTQSYNKQNKSGYKFTMERLKDYNITYRIDADNIAWDSLKNKWKLQTYTIRQLQAKDDILIKGADTLMRLPIVPNDYDIQVYEMEKMTTPKLKHFIHDQVIKGAENVKFYQLELHRRTAIPFSVIILTIIAVALTTHKVRNGMGIYLVLGLLISGAFIIVQQFSSVFAIKGNLDPLIGAWIPNIVFSVLAVFLIIRAPK
ncbi:MAG: LptF/LptG family permease [Sphingobacteriales bacterium]|nr:MAG: LptF/LptG family permease [Sphingobacteriales bacterium]